MKGRCENPNSFSFKDYGGRGIKVCDAWTNFATFYQWAMENGYQENLTLDRVDVNRGYSPDNCRWVTREQQNRNTTRTHRIVSGGGEITAAEAGRMVGVDRSTVAKWCREGKIKTIADVQYWHTMQRKKKEGKVIVESSDSVGAAGA